MKKFIKITALIAMSLSLCACKMSAQTVKSKTGMVSVKVKNEAVTLNHVEFEFPEDYKLEEGLISEPLGISLVNVYNDDHDFIGIAADGKYDEDIDEDNFTDAVNDVIQEIYDTDGSVTFSDDPVVYGDKLGRIIVDLGGDSAIFIAELDTPNFVYMSQTEDDEDDEMIEFIESAVEQLGSDEDADVFDEEIAIVFED